MLKICYSGNLEYPGKVACLINPLIKFCILTKVAHFSIKILKRIHILYDLLLQFTIQID